MFELDEFQNLIRLVDDAETIHEKGQRFEELSAYLFEHLDGVEVIERDVHMASEEIDLVLWNAQTEEVLRPWEAVILVECKNWSEAVGAAVLDNFVNKVRRRALKIGIFIAANGVTGNFVKGDANDRGAVGILRSALQDGLRIIVITMDDIRAVNSLDDIRDMVKKKYCGIFVHKFL
ncbi:restriction endonuclease [Thalassospira povalilytica]|uniref:Restriction endonuclease n=1 Tax=Thalassospira povalilytica TaxID=732237 RepID=A0A8I1M9Z5_9PROT|nr:restriction endonuclease [Thalassospira povalilytica]MBN8197759.1 restriction endonuclease [Thalassospira povalilytica]